MRVLLTNDDGFHAEGIKVLKEIIIASCIASEIWIIAPLANCSYYGRSIALRNVIEVYQVNDTEFIVNSTPSTSVFLGLREILDKKPDLILSGINNGINIGNDVGYSGTIAAAAEGAMMNIPSIAISQQYNGETGEINWVNPQKFLKKIINMLLDLPFWNKSTVMNVNFPLVPAKDIKFTGQGKYASCSEIDKKENVANNSMSYTINRIFDKNNSVDSDSSVQAIADGCITIMPLKFDMTDFDMLESFTSLNKDCII